jgi:hypothetical protein
MRKITTVFTKNQETKILEYEIWDKDHCLYCGGENPLYNSALYLRSICKRCVNKVHGTRMHYLINQGISKLEMIKE